MATPSIIKKLYVTLEHDHDTENPCNGDSGVTLYRFDHPWQVEIHETGDISYQAAKNHDWVTFDIDKNGETWWWLSCYKHGGEAWSLMGEGTSCQWDTTRKAGIIQMSDETAEYYKGSNLSRKQHPVDFMRLMLDDYNDWSSGNCWWYNVSFDQERNVEGTCPCCETPEVNWYEREKEEWEQTGGILGLDNAISFVEDTLDCLVEVHPEVADYLLTVEGVESDYVQEKISKMLADLQKDKVT